jgi:hypothetical protein
LARCATSGSLPRATGLGAWGMSGVFLSYSRGDRDLAQRIVGGLRSLEVDVWWDEDMPGVDWQEELARQINELAAVLVLWTPLSGNSKNVRDEARLGQQTEKLVNVIVGVAAPPFPFDRFNGLPLDGWTGRERHGGWTRLIRTVEERLVAVGGTKPGKLTSALKQWERSIEDRRRALADSESAYNETKLAESVSCDAMAGARAEFAAAEAQLRSVMDMKAGPALLRAAQQQLDAALAAQTDAEQARRSAAAMLATASRSLASSKAELERMFRTVTPSAPPAQEGRPAPPRDERAGAAQPPRSSPDAASFVERATSVFSQQARWPVLVLAGIAVLVVVGAWVFVDRPAPTPHRTITSVSASTVPMIPAASGVRPRPSTPSTAQIFVTKVVGSWDVGLGCSDPVIFSEEQGGPSRTFAGAVVLLTFAPTSIAGVVGMSAPDGSHYELRTNDNLWLTPTGGASMELTKCAG